MYVRSGSKSVNVTLPAPSVSSTKYESNSFVVEVKNPIEVRDGDHTPSRVVGDVDVDFEVAGCRAVYLELVNHRSGDVRDRDVFFSRCHVVVCVDYRQFYDIRDARREVQRLDYPGI